ncbi:hydrogenase expression/formation protein HypE [Hyalangium minutum]|uniref:[NiFe] hydrogenase metallocenter assembly protein HypE n=1 Tax=Hyalangium minutum TaxID=394096 RepID=A0A085WHA6_9BACT|nr:hydrogenase expression/formation protein HypE [Hyalangium minutum]KFE67069.1 [NiFe] hydrogenase metallocenter assembly protein HypE [Hyalangium minutum]
MSTLLNRSCPAPLKHSTIQLAHGGGGRLMRQLIEEVFLEPPPALAWTERHDSAVVPLGTERLALTTDSYVVTPRFFPGGDIGKLAVYGTVNDLVMSGARPLYLSAGFILEEGLAMEELRRVVASMREAARECGVRLVTGDTKVVDRGKADGLFINTSGAGHVPEGRSVHPRRVRPGDAVLVSGDVGQHGIAVLSVREGLAFETPVQSDCSPLTPLVEALFSAGVDVHALRDTTRGGLASALNELALDGGVSVLLEETSVPVNEAVSGACELLGLDPLYVACEGRMVAFVPEPQAEVALAALRGHPLGVAAARIGRVTEGPAGRVSLRTRLGGHRLLDLLSGEQLPRIC